MIEAYILVQTEVGRARVVANNARSFNGIIKAEVVAGPYDVIVLVHGTDESAIRNSVLAEIQRLEYVTRTLTCTILS